MSGIDGMIDVVKSSVKELRSLGVKDELVLVVPSWTYLNYLPAWERVKEETGVDHVEELEGIGLPHNVEAMVVQRSEYLRMFIKSLGEKESESNGK